MPHKHLDVADLLKDLQVDPQANIRDALEVRYALKCFLLYDIIATHIMLSVCLEMQVQANQTSSTQEGLDPSGSATADSSHVQTDYAGMDGGMYYALNGYPAHHGYFIGGKLRACISTRRLFEKTGDYPGIFQPVYTSDIFFLFFGYLSCLAKMQGMTILWIGRIIQGILLPKVVTHRMQ
jgi:hypothetical protein